jgi:hypothetical protein
MKANTLLYGAIIAIILLAPQAFADDANPDEPKTMSGISILGNQEAPKSLVIVPWKGSELGANPGLASDMLDAGAVPVDRDVFMRQLDYYQIRAGRETDITSRR